MVGNLVPGITRDIFGMLPNILHWWEVRVRTRRIYRSSRMEQTAITFSFPSVIHWYDTENGKQKVNDMGRLYYTFTGQTRFIGYIHGVWRLRLLGMAAGSWITKTLSFLEAVLSYRDGG